MLPVAPRNSGQHSGPWTLSWLSRAGAKEIYGTKVRWQEWGVAAESSPWVSGWVAETLWLLGSSQPWLLPQVDKETNTETPAPSPTVVRPKDRRVGTPSPGPFLRGSTIIRSKTFSPGPQSQYVCRVSKCYVVLSSSQRACFPQGSQEPSASHGSGCKSPLRSHCQVTSGKVTPLSLSFLTWS